MLGGGVVLGALLAGGQVPALYQLPHPGAGAAGVPHRGAEPGHVGAGAVNNGLVRIRSGNEHSRSL